MIGISDYIEVVSRIWHNSHELSTGQRSNCVKQTCSDFQDSNKREGRGFRTLFWLLLLPEKMIRIRNHNLHWPKKQKRLQLSSAAAQRFRFLGQELPKCDFFPRRSFAVAPFSSSDGFLLLGGRCSAVFFCRSRNPRGDFLNDLF